MQSESLRIQTERGVFHGIATGATTQSVVLCLHGFPDNCETYAMLLPLIARQGFRVVAVNLRGYSPSPLEGPYRAEDLAEDILAICRALSPTAPVYVVGHDIGGQTLYRAMSKQPSLFLAGVILAAPHPQAIIRNSRRSFRQPWQSRYIILMQFRGFAEWWVSRKDCRYVEKLWREWSPKFTLPEIHLRSVKETITASMPAPIEMYRSGDFAGSPEKLSTPTLLLMGDRDGCVVPAMAEGQEALFTRRYELRVIPNTGHFLHLEAPELINECICEWFRSVPQAPSAKRGTEE